MIKEYLQIRTLSIVIIGEFNPPIIQPFWLANKKLIREHEAENAVVDIIHQDLVRFQIDWAFIQVTRNQIELRTSKEPYFEPLRDLVVGIFEMLRETPITALGINNILHYGITSDQRYYEIGNKLAPLSNWSGFLNEPRMKKLEILEQNRSDKLPGSYMVSVQPSTEKLTTNKGIMVILNDHLSLKPEETGREKELIKRMTDVWSESLEKAEFIPAQLWDKLKL